MRADYITEYNHSADSECEERDCSDKPFYILMYWRPLHEK